MRARWPQLLAALALGAWAAPGGPAPAPRPPVSAEPADREAVADAKRDQSIALLRGLLLARSDDDPEKAEMYFQLAELTQEKSRAVFRRELQVAQETPPDGGQPPEADHRGSEVLRSETIRLAELVLERYPAYPRRDELLYTLASTLEDAGRRPQAAARYEELLRAHPSSRFVPDALVQLGNYHFDVAGSVPRARAAYQRALGGGSPRVQAYALYRLAWCDLNQGDLQGALGRLQETVELAGRQHAFGDLQTQALDDSVRVYVQLQAPAEAAAWYRQHAPRGRVPVLLAAVGEGLLAAGQHRAALGLFQELLSEQPDWERAPTLQRGVVRAAEGLHDRPRALEELQALALRYLPGTPWWAANEAHQAARLEGLAAAAEAVRAQAADWHLEAQRSGAAATYRLAGEAYRISLQAHAALAPAEVVRAERLGYAEVLTALGDDAGAGAQYDLAAAAPGSPAEQAQAASAAVRAWDRTVRKERAQRPARTSPVAEAPLSTAEAALVAACDRSLALAGAAPQAVDVAYQAAAIFLERGQVSEASRRLGQLIERHPGEARARDAAELSMRALEERQAWPALEELGRKFLANTSLAPAGSDFARRLTGVVERASYLALDALVKEQHQPAKALPLLVAHEREFPSADTGDRALAYALSLAVELRQLDTAADVARRLLAGYPSSMFELPARYQLGLLAERLGDFEGAAAAMEAFVAAWERARAVGPRGGPEARRAERAALLEACTRRPDHWVQNAMFDAALWREGLGQLEAARAAWGRYLARFPGEPDAPAVAAREVGLLARLGRPADALRAAQAHLARHARDPRVSSAQRLELLDQALALAEASGPPAEARRLAAAVEAEVGRLPREEQAGEPAVRALAHARFTALEPGFRAFQALTLARAPAFREELAAKQQRLQALEAGYTAVLALGDAPWGLAALTRLGLLSADLAARVAAAPAPAGLDADQQALFKNELETRYVLPLETRAGDALEKAVAKASQLGLSGAWLTAAQDQLELYHPGSFPPARVLAFSPLPAGFEPEATEAEARAFLARQPEQVGAWLRLGQAALGRGQLPLARLRLERALSLSGSAPEVQAWLGVAAWREGEAPAAQLAFQRALAAAPRQPLALLGLGLLALQRRDFATASALLAQAAEEAPGAAEVQLALGWALDARRVREPALALQAGEALARAVELGTPDAGAACAAGWAFAAAPAGRERARAWLGRCLRAQQTPAEERARIEARLRALEGAAGGSR